MEPYETVLNVIRPKVSFGSATIRVYRPLELKSGQVGYFTSASGESFIGDTDGDWRNTWFVIGYDETSGDPIFIDKSKEGYPVYTAMIGMGRWDPMPIAVSLEAFGQALSAVATVAKGRENPVALEQNPLSEAERDRALAAIQ